MNRNAAYREPVNSRSLLTSAVGLLATAMLMGLSGTASAAPPGKNGTIHACYKVKGKPKGAMRIVMSSKARCRRGERKVAWTAVGTGGKAGANGQPGASGSETSTSANEAALKTEIASLNLRLEALEGMLSGITRGELLGAVGAVPVVDALCEQTPELVEQVNTLQGVIGGLGLEPALELIGLLEVPTLPTPLEPFSCP